MNQISQPLSTKPVFWYKVSKKLNGLARNEVLIHLLSWLIFAGVFFLGIGGVEPLPKALSIIGAVFLPSVPAVYLHFFVFDKWLRNRQYVFYILVLLGIVWWFGWLIELIAIHVVFANEPSTSVSGKLALVCFVVVSTGFRSLFEGLQAKSKLAQLEAMQTRAELESLKSQVNPHFLFNSLNDIYGQLMDDQAKAGESLLNLSSLLRYLIYASQKTSISLAEEVRFLEDYMAMERLRLGEKCELVFEKSGDISSKSLSPFLLIPFVENAFKHGSFATVAESYIHVTLQVEGANLLFEVKNSTKSTAHTFSTGTGIANVKRRLELLMPNSHELLIQPGTDFFEIKLTLAL